jgi:hypothetical protein
MHAMLKTIEADDPHDAPAIAPDIVPAAWADKVLADITNGPAPDPKPTAPSTAASAAQQPIDTTFRAAAVGSVEASRAKPPGRTWMKSTLVAFLFALCSAMAAAAWQHYGGAARQMVANWTPAFALATSPPPAQAAPIEQADASAVQAPAADQASAPHAASAPPPASAAADTSAASPDSSQMIQSMSRDLAAMGQQIQELKASIADLKAGQQTMARDNTRTSEARTSEPRTVEARTPPPATRAPIQTARPKLTAPPPPMRAAAAPARRPMPAYPAYPSVQAAAAPPPYPVAPAAAPPPLPQAAVDPLDEPVVRPPMPLR